MPPKNCAYEDIDAGLEIVRNKTLIRTVSSAMTELPTIEEFQEELQPLLAIGFRLEFIKRPYGLICLQGIKDDETSQFQVNLPLLLPSDLSENLKLKVEALVSRYGFPVLRTWSKVGQAIELTKTEDVVLALGKSYPRSDLMDSTFRHRHQLTLQVPDEVDYNRTPVYEYDVVELLLEPESDYGFGRWGYIYEKSPRHFRLRMQNGHDKSIFNVGVGCVRFNRYQNPEEYSKLFSQVEDDI